MKPTLKTSLLKLALVGILFYASYSLSNHYAASLAYVPEIAFAWERGIPFWEWTILPYWSLNLMYAAAFFLCRNACEQNRYVARLVSAQIIATTCFILFPLHFGWPKPPTDGLWGVMFDSLVAFDLPYNQSPSLHIALLLDAVSQNPLADFAVAKPDCLVGTDDLPTPFYRRADRCAAGLAGVVGHTETRRIAFQTAFWYSRPSENEQSEFLRSQNERSKFPRSQNFPRNTFPRNQNRHAVSGGRGITGPACPTRRRVVVDVVGQCVAIGSRFRLSDR